MAVFPIAQLLVHSDVEPVRAGLDGFVTGLTAWQPQSRETGMRVPPRIGIEANGYEAAFDRMNRLFIANAWGDGLPLVPPTDERVAWVLQGTPRDPATPLGKLMPRGGVVTAETAAVSLAMAGGRPEYLPVLLAALDAILDPGMDHDKAQATSGSTFPVVVVNGPAARDIRLNSGFGLLGPDPQHPAGAAIGRALRLLLQNVGGALPGVGTMAIFGAMRYTNAVFAEDEEGLPEGWLPVGAEHGGASPGDDVVTVYTGAGATNVQRRGVGKEEAMEEALQGLHRAAGYIGVPNAHYPRSYNEGIPGALLVPRVVAGQLAALGWKSKADVSRWLWEHTRLPGATVRESGLVQWILAEADPRTHASVDADPWPICARPEQIMIVVAGGAHPTHNYWMQSWGPRLATRRLELPGHWQRLLDEAEADLGPGGDACRIG